MMMNSDDSEVELIQTVETVGQIITSKNKKSIFAEMEIGANPVRFQVDCGATVNILPKKYVGSNKIEKTSKPSGHCTYNVRTLYVHCTNGTYNVRTLYVQCPLGSLTNVEQGQAEA